MSLTVISAADAAARLDDFDAVVDARSPAEYAEDRLPGAVNWPVLDDDERRVVGTEYVQVSAFEARKIGAAMVARRMAEHIEAHLMDKPRDWQPLVYCWRGGQRSGTLAWFLDRIGFRTCILEGGYKAFRALVREQLEALPARFGFVVVAGPTGSGKTRLLQALERAGAQVLDLEALACHRGSVLGALPHAPQPSQKAFDTAVWDRLRRFDPARPVFVESESRKIGALQVPQALLGAMRERGHCVLVSMPDHARLALLLEEYAFFADEPDRFCALLEPLVPLRGRETVQRWQALAREGRWAQAFDALMREHYDPLYEQSMQRNYRLDRCQPLALPDGSAAAIEHAARSLCAAELLPTGAASAS